jgi:hypothetical protein
MKKLLLSFALALAMVPALQAATVPMGMAQVDIDPATGKILGLPVTGGSGGSTQGVSVTAFSGAAGATMAELSGSAKAAAGGLTYTPTILTQRNNVNCGVGPCDNNWFFPNTGKSIRVLAVQFSAAQACLVQVKFGAAGGITNVFSSGYVAANGGNTVVFGLNGPKGAVNQAIYVYGSTAGDYDCTITYIEE